MAMYQKFRAFDCALPANWYPHTVQSALMGAGIKMPVYKRNLEKVLRENDDSDVRLPGKSDMVFVPHFGDRSIDIIYDADEDYGNPLALENRDNLCLLITPPIPGFDYSKFMHGIPILGDDVCADEEIREDLCGVMEGYLPEFFREAALDVQDQSLRTLVHSTHGMHKFVVMGCKLSPLTSGKANIVMFLKFEQECPFEHQMYIPIYGSNMKIRIIPKPIITKNTQTKMKNLDIVVKMYTFDEALFDYAYKFGNDIITHDLGLNSRHIRLNKANQELIIAGHTLGDISISAYAQKSIIKKIQMGLQPYIVKDVSFKIFEGY